MQPSFLISNNTTGNHPADKWAMTAAEMLADITDVAGDRALAGQKLRVKFAEVLAKHFNDISESEQTKLLSDPDHINTQLWDALDTDLEQVADELASAAADSPWSYHYQTPEVRAAVMAELHRLFLTSIQVDRMAYATANGVQ